MPAMSSDEIQKVSISVVEDFLNNKIPMSTGLAKQASERGMNMEQIKRACEASNVISHLKLLQLSKDRTIEFPVCDVNEVMGAMCTPAMSKQASEVVSTHKESVTEVPGYEYSMPTQDSIQYFIKSASENKAAIESLECDSIVTTDKLMKLAAELSKEADWNDKLSCVATEFHKEISTLISGSASDRRDLSGTSFYKQAELAKYEEVAELFKMAKCMVAEKAKRAELQKRVDGIVKEAMIGTLGGLAGKGAGFLTSAVGKGVAGAVKGVGSGVAGVAKGAYNVGMGSLSRSGVGRAFNMTPVAPTKAGQRFKTIAPIAGAVGMDSYFYRASGGPGVTSSGASKDVWDSLQG